MPNDSVSKLLAKANYHKMLEGVWNDVDKKSSLGIYQSSYTLPNNQYLADMLFDSLEAHTSVKKVELVEGDDGDSIFLILDFTPPTPKKRKRASKK